jgi:hypothetical protein
MLKVFSILSICWKTKGKNRKNDLVHWFHILYPKKWRNKNESDA